MPSGASTAALAALALLPLALAGAPADASLNAAGLPLMTPTSASAANHTYYFEIPIDPVGLLVMLHRCGRSAEDFWPPSGACPECIGMPEAVSISRQALARGYALLAINSFNRTVGSLGRCWSLATDALPVRELVTAFRQLHGLADLPLFVTGCSSGGLLALRLPSFMALDGIMPVAIGLDLDSFPPNLPRQNHTYPPVAYFHFSRDNTTTTQVEAMVEFSQAAGLPASQVTVQPSQFTPDFFSQRDPLISLALSEQLHSMLKNRLKVLNGSDFLIEGWTEEVSTVELRQEVERVAEAAGAVSSYCVAESGDGTAADLTPDLLYHHVLEELGVAWAEHTNLGDYTAATLVWLERCGTANFSALAEQYKVQEPAALSPLRTAPASEVSDAWRDCKPGRNWTEPAGATQGPKSSAGSASGSASNSSSASAGDGAGVGGGSSGNDTAAAVPSSAAARSRVASFAAAAAAAGAAVALVLL